MNIQTSSLRPRSAPLPMSRGEMHRLGWTELDILLVSGDAYVDHPSFGMAIIGRLLLDRGYRVGIIAQPDWRNPSSLIVMGTPKIACAVSSGNLDSMLNIYTAARRLRREDAYSPCGSTELRPPHATIVYSQLARRAFPGTPVIIGGIEASLRRFAHYDYWQDKIRPGILCDSKADILIYGMGERAIVEVVEKISEKKSLDFIKGTAKFIGRDDSRNFKSSGNYLELPSYEEHLGNRDALLKSATIVEREMNPFCGRGLIQRYSNRILIQEPPAPPLSVGELDAIYEMPFTYLPHPSYKKKIPAYEMIKNSITAVRGCPGSCSFCGLGIHQGKFVVSRSEASIIREVRRLTSHCEFRGTITDVGGPTANAYGSRRKNPELCEKCVKISCLFPEICGNYVPDEDGMMKLLEKVSDIEKVRHVFISSGLRLDLALRQKRLLRKIIRDHVSGHLKIAPEHLDNDVLRLMRKNKFGDFYEFMRIFD